MVQTCYSLEGRKLNTPSLGHGPKRDPNVKVTKGRTSSRFGHVTTWSKRELCKRSPSLSTTPS
ncbi:hypothetical protein PIB30_101016, partial [Stylosanthes scabra]|nr:hypothetical protein [Stylosanthes scabra]